MPVNTALGARRANSESKGKKWPAMSLSNKKKEISRLISAFETEADKFHDIKFSIYYVTQEGPNTSWVFHKSNHNIMLWQYQGMLGVDKTPEDLQRDLETSDLQWGVRGAKLSLFGVIEGDSTDRFVRMAKRAGAIFDKTESGEILNRIVNEVIFDLKDKEKGKPVVNVNSNKLSLWLNYLLYHLSLDNPSRPYTKHIEPDPYSLSLLALERLLESLKPEKVDKSYMNVKDIKFKVALSFPGGKRLYVAKVTEQIKAELAQNSVFYDFDYQSQLAVPNLDTLLQKIYRDNSDLIVVFICEEYAEKDWCGLEWRAVKDIIKSREDEKIMFVRFDDASIDGVFSTDGYIDGNRFSPEEVGEFILERVKLNEQKRT